MDNLSHSVAGLLAGEILQRALPQEAEPGNTAIRHRLLLLSCCLASNFPDLDLFLTSLLPAPLGYLLHHRGHTHTILYALPQALLLALLTWALWPAARRLLRQSRAARAGWALALCTGFALHLLMDYLNSYGLHPFHPFASRWLYGDMVFILEPVFWTAFGVPMFMLLPRKWLRWALPALLAVALLLFSMRGFLAWQSLLALFAIGALLARLQRRQQGARQLSALLLAAGLGLGFVAVQALAAHAAREAIVDALGRRDPGAKFIDAALTAFPSNPACWNVVALQARAGEGSYRISRGVLSIAPRWMPALSCPRSFIAGAALPAASDAVALLWQEDASLTRLRQLARDNCHFNAWMRFARMPLLEGSRASDARFASGLRDNFSTLELNAFAGNACERRVPQWDYPRADLLTAPAPQTGPARAQY
jgi:inner membrane protein